MRIDVVQKIMPGWSAATVLTKEHAEDAAQHARRAVTADDISDRLDAAVRTMTSLDHAIDNVSKLPAKWFIPNSGTYLAGYQAAKLAVTLLVASGVIPGARERVGREQLLAARDALHDGLAVADGATGRTRFGGKLSSGWMNATLEDAAAGSLMLRDRDGAELLRTLASMRSQAGKRQPVDPASRARAEELFADATGELDDRIAAARAAAEAGAAPAASETATSDPVVTALLGRTDALLAQAAQAASLLRASAPRIEELADAAR